MLQEPSSAHAFRHDPTDGSRQLAEGRRHAVVRALALLDEVLVVPRKQLVTAVASEHYLDVLRRELRHDVGGDCRRVAEGLVKVPREILHDSDHVGPQNQLVVLGVERTCDVPGVAKLVVSGLDEPY